MPTKVKICGITSEDALLAALDAGAEYVGFVFFDRSPRNITPERAGVLARMAHENGATKVVVLLVDPGDRLIDQVIRDVRPDVIQLHGHETPTRVEEIVRGTQVPVWKAVAVSTAADVEAACSYTAPGMAERVLFDAKPPVDSSALPGGNGLAFDWRILAAARTQNYILAGGLTADNVADAIVLTGAPVVDVSSGVERAPGVKDPELIRRFIRNAKAAS